DKNIQAKLEAKTIRIQAPIPGKSTVGIEAENKVQEIVSFRSCIDDPLFDNPKKPLNCVLGVDFDNKNCFFDLEDAPHLLIAGSTGKGKSVCLNTIIVSLLLRNNPSEVRLILVDPKRVELSDYAEIPHLLTPIIYDTKDAVKALGWLVGEMNERYRLFQEHKVKKISEFNEKVNEDCSAESLPRIVLIIDELSNLMNESSTEIDYYMETLANKARACGIHMICATQRPTVKVINGNIKNNFPKRIAFAVPSATDSSTIIDSKDATTLVGKGDMLFKDDSELKRLQGAFIENADIRACMDYIRSISTPKYAFYASDLGSLTKTIDDEVYDAAIYVVSYNSASTNSLMIKFNWGFDKATRIMNVLEKEGIVGPLISNKAREVLVGLPEVKGILKHE
ncbi:MAG: DNA translocase FtsK, partial [Acholeplasmatales bacterium]|nr:DNA translocase FtsK [Acholeplasmatales bacterium]